MAAKRKPRRFSDEERAAALAALAANGGNVAKTARQVGVPRKTLSHWAKGTRHPEAAKMGQLKKGNLADAFEDAAWKLIGVALDKADKMGGKDAMVAAAVAVDKMRLLRELPTEIVKKDGTVTSRIERLTESFEKAADCRIAGDLLRNDRQQRVDTNGFSGTH